MSEMVERVAKAICASLWGKNARGGPDFDARYKAAGRAAIAAMREPTEEMLRHSGFRPAYAEEVWQNMLDEALKS